MQNRRTGGLHYAVIGLIEAIAEDRRVFAIEIWQYPESPNLRPAYRTTGGHYVERLSGDLYKISELELVVQAVKRKAARTS